MLIVERWRAAAAGAGPYSGSTLKRFIRMHRKGRCIGCGQKTPCSGGPF